jgi:hypothetical protein
MDPRRLKQWQQMNEVDYSHKLSVLEKQWLHAFNSDYFKTRPRQDAMDQCPDPLSESLTTPEEPSVYKAPQSYGGVTLVDLKIYLRIHQEGVSERQAAKESFTPRSTLKYRMLLVKKLLTQVSWSNLLGNLEGEEKSDQVI